MLNIHNAGFRYNNNQWIFRNLDFQARPGEIVAILGPNGRGKTTLIKALAGLHQLDDGQIHLTGSVGYVPQDSWTPFPYSVMDMVLMGRARHIGIFASPRKKDIDIAHKSLQLLNAYHFRDRLFTTLSGGERQLVLIARALASDCDCLLLDEPASALDFKNQQIILTTLKQLATGRNLTILLTTHYPQHAVYIADKALLMYGNEDFLFGEVNQVMNNENLGRLYNMDICQVEFPHKERMIQTVVPVFS